MKIAVLADTLLIDNNFGHFGDMCRRMISSACETAQVDLYDVKGSKFPSNIHEYSGVIITASLCSVCDGELWVQELEEFIRFLDRERVRMVGLAFGHQVIAHALGGEVERNPRGWEIGWHSFPLTTAATRRLTGLCSWDGTKQILELLYFHQDHVKRLPEGAIPLGGTKLCAIEGFVKGDYILTFQGQPEFSFEIVESLVKGHLQQSLCAESFDVTLRSLHKRNHTYADADFVAHRVAEFFTSNSR